MTRYRSRHLTFSLATLLVVVTACCVGAWWWQLPYTTETPRNLYSGGWSNGRPVTRPGRFVDSFSSTIVR